MFRICRGVEQQITFSTCCTKSIKSEWLNIGCVALTWTKFKTNLKKKTTLSAFPMYYSLYNWIGEHEITKLKKIASNPEKGHKNKYKKTWMKWNDTKLTIWYFQQCASVNSMYFAPVVTTTVCMKNNKSSKKDLRTK